MERDILIKQIFDEQYEIYRNLLNKPKIPLEARELIFTCMSQYADKFKLPLIELDKNITVLQGTFYAIEKTDKRAYGMTEEVTKWKDLIHKALKNDNSN